MKFTCNTQALSLACQQVSRAISSRTTIPALEGIHLRAENQQILLTGYDLEVGIQTQIPAEIEQEGVLVLGAKVFCELLKRVAGEQLQLESDARFLAKIECGESEFTINGMSPEEYPELPSITGGTPLPISLKLLKEMIRQTIFAVAVGADTKPIHTGVKFELTPSSPETPQGTLQLAAIDGFRLALRTEDIDYAGEALDFVVPPKALQELMKRNHEDDEMISVGIGKRHIVFDSGSSHMVSRLIDGEFMNYKAALPTNFKTEASSETRSLISAIDRISLIITEKVKSPIRCEIQPELGKLNFSCSTGVGSARDSVSADVLGEYFEVGFNNRFLLDALKACDTDQIRLNFNGPIQPVVILPPEGQSFLFMVLPVRLREEPAS